MRSRTELNGVDDELQLPAKGAGEGADDLDDGPVELLMCVRCAVFYWWWFGIET